VYHNANEFFYVDAIDSNNLLIFISLAFNGVESFFYIVPKQD